MLVKRLMTVLFTSVLTLILITSCSERNNLSDSKEPLKSYLETPGITDEEIQEIENLKKEKEFFIYGMIGTNESFKDESGTVCGFTAYFCKWLSMFFDIEFIPVVVEWDNLVNQLELGVIHFTGELTATPERINNKYYMTSPIVEREIKYVQLDNSVPLNVIKEVMPLKLAFLKGASTVEDVKNSLSDYNFEVILVENCEVVYDLLKRGVVHAFFGERIEVNFDNYSDVVARSLFPATYGPVSMSTKQANLQPIISVMQKVLDSGNTYFIIDLYNKGDNDYNKFKLNARLNEQERNYLISSKSIDIVAEYDNFPVSFYNTATGKFEGIALDILNDIESMTDLRFNIINKEDTGFDQLLGMLKSGEAKIISELIRTDEREGNFIWPANSFFKENIALISTVESEQIHLNEILFLRIGLVRTYGQSEIFLKWFPNHKNIVDFTSSQEAFNALKEGEIDLYLTSQSRLLQQTHYLEYSGFNIGLKFDYPITSTFGFNKDELILSAIFDKALSIIDTKAITDYWMNKIYNNNEHYVRILSNSVIILIVLLSVGIIFGFFITGKFLKITHSLETQNELLKVINDMSSNLSNSEFKNLNENINKSLNDTANVLSANRILIFKNIRKNKKLFCSVIYNWEKDDSKLINNLIKDFELSFEETLIGLEDLLLKGDCILKRLNEVPEPVQSILKTLETKFLLIAPLKYNEKLWGFITYEYCDDVHTLTELEVKTVDLLSKLICQNICNYDNITSLLETNNKFSESLIEVEKRSLFKSQYLSLISEEIKEPILKMMGMTDHLLKKQSSHQFESALNMIHDYQNLLLYKIYNVLDLLKIESGDFELIRTNYSLVNIINEITKLVRARNANKLLDFSMSIFENTPIELFGDEFRLVQILNNILANSFRFTNSGKIDFNIFVKPLENDVVNLCFTISDSGIGMTYEQLANVFDEYNHFGMPITKKIVDKMDGDIKVISKHDKGTTVFLEIPQRSVSTKTVSDVDIDQIKRIIKKNESPDKKYIGDGYVLAVDDMKSNLYVTNNILLNKGLKVDLAESGIEAIEMVRKCKEYDIIFMDHLMSNMDGIEATKRIRELGYMKKIVALTSNSANGIEVMLKKNGFDDFLSKPIIENELRRVLDLVYQN